MNERYEKEHDAKAAAEALNAPIRYEYRTGYYYVTNSHGFFVDYAPPGPYVAVERPVGVAAEIVAYVTRKVG